MYRKGQMFRSIYNCRGFLSDVYLDSEISIKTTRMGRTYMSAAMILAGMYPPRSYQKWSNFETVWQPIPIYSDSPDHTPVCTPTCIEHFHLCTHSMLRIIDKLLIPMYKSIQNNNHTPLGRLYSVKNNIMYYR